jgi:hypothetical protein
MPPPYHQSKNMAKMLRIFKTAEVWDKNDLFSLEMFVNT